MIIEISNTKHIGDIMFSPPAFKVLSTESRRFEWDKIEVEEACELAYNFIHFDSCEIHSSMTDVTFMVVQWFRKDLAESKLSCDKIGLVSK